MSAEELTKSLREYTDQLTLIREALNTASESSEKESLLSLQSDLNQLLQLTQESLDTVLAKVQEAKPSSSEPNGDEKKSALDDEYALFMAEMSKSGAYEDKDNLKDKPETSNDGEQDGNSDASDIENELATLLGMKCAVYHTHKWGGQPTLYNAMVSSVIPRQDEDQFSDLQVRVLFTHPTHAEMLPCPFYLDGECRFDEEQCRYSHGAVVPLSSLKEAIEPDFEAIKMNSRVLVKLKPPDDEDTSLTRKSTEKYHLWHRAVVNTINEDKRTCLVKLEQGHNTRGNKKSADVFTVPFEDFFPLNNEESPSSDSESSLSDTEYPRAGPSAAADDDADADVRRALLAERSLQCAGAGPPMGEWERHTRGIGSKLMLAMGYVPGTGLGASSGGRLAPVEARAVPPGRSLDHCMALRERAAATDPLKVEQKLKRLQRKEEEKHKRAYEREKEKERRNVFNFLNRTLGDNASEEEATPKTHTPNIKQSTNKDLNIEQFKLTEETKRLERDLTKLNSSLQRNPSDKHLNMQIGLLQKELEALRNKEKQITNEQRQRRDKQKMAVF